MEVLLIGNSQIQSNDLPTLITMLSDSAPKGAERIELSAALIGGNGFQGYWDAGEGEGTPRGMIASQEWDYVIIQEIFCVKEPEFIEYATRFDNEIRKAGSRTLLFATANVSEFYPEPYPYPESFKTLNDMQVAFGRKHGIPVAAAGYAWMRYLGHNPSDAQRLDLYAEDKGHPGIKGSYIYACLLYAHITGHNPELLPLPDADWDCANGVVITTPELANMRKAAWEQYQEDTSRA